MMWLELSAALSAALLLALFWRGRRLREIPPDHPEIDEALARVARGDTNVRIEPLRCGRQARLASRFNELVTRIDAGALDWTGVDRQERALFESLRSAAAVRDNPLTFVAIAEVDRFTFLRQSIGFELANGLLGQIAQRIAGALFGAEIGRMGRTNVEFAFRANSVAEAQLRLLAAVATIEREIEIDGYAFDLSVTIGFADAASSSIREELIDRAAAALAAAQSKRVKVGFADPVVLEQHSRTDLDLMRALPKALAAGEVQLYYQPKLEARTDTFKSAEALIRWIRPETGLVPTERFIQVAEESGAIRNLTKWVIARAISDQKRMMEEGFILDIYVNISGQLLHDRGFAQEALELVQGAAGKIGFEITETAVIEDPEAALANLRDFTSAGIRLAIDDYGSGLSSLAYLKQLPANELKIDRMFVSGLTESHRDPLLVRSSIDLAHALEMEVTAEGVDDAMSLSLLRIMGCDLLQGYYISPPLPLAEFIHFLGDEEQLQRISRSPRPGEWLRSGND